MVSPSPPSSYQSFAKIFSSFHEHYAESQPGPSSSGGPSHSSQIDSVLGFDALFDEEQGMLTALTRSLEQEIQDRLAGSEGEGRLSDDLRDALLREHRTWQLLRVVYENRLSREDPFFVRPSSIAAVQHNPYMTPHDLTQLVVAEDDDLSLWAVLVEHLHSRPVLTSPPPLEARHGYLPSTLRRAKAAQLASGNTAAPPSLDPDFTLRDPQGPGLAGEDQTYQSPLLETLWDLIRHGEFEQAIHVAEQGGEPWRAASLMGGRRWGMGGLTTESIGMTALEGNRQRALWKKACRTIAKNPTLSTAERALYAAITSDLPTLLPACKTWEDQLWARVISRLEARLEARWADLGGFWEEESRTLGRDDQVAGAVGGGGLEVVFAEIEGVQDPALQSIQRDPYYAAQRMILCGQTSALVTHFAEHLHGIEDAMSPELIGPLIRFFAHLILVLRSIGREVPETDANVILQAYLHILEREGNDALVAMYAACLREGSGETSYARFLRTMDPHASRDARVEALNRAKAHNLDVAAIARETVRLTLQEAFATIPALSREEPDITTFRSALNERDVYLIRAIEWLTMVPATTREALRRANDVGRYFLALGQANAAQALLESLPPHVAAGEIADGQELVREQEQEQEQEQDALDQLEEHDGMLRLFGVFAAHEVVQEVHVRAPGNTATKMEVHNWRKALRSAIDKTYALTVELLTSDWMVFPHDSPIGGVPRQRELARVRQIFIPDLVLRLHALLVAHGAPSVSAPHAQPELLRLALDLAGVVADETNGVYPEFFARGAGAGAGRLGVYLEKVREVYLLALREGLDVPGSAVRGATATGGERLAGEERVVSTMGGRKGKESIQA